MLPLFLRTVIRAMGNEADPKGRPRRLGMVADAMVAGADEEEAASDDSASDELPLSASV